MTLVTFPVKAAAPKSEPARYVSLAETNKILRAHLKRAFPGTKFGVRGSSYSGGSSTDITWTDGPTRAQVEAVTDAYSSRGFDGMIDMAYSKTSWLLPTGEIVRGYSHGTENAAGSVEGYAIPKPHPQAEAVHSGIGYVHCRRTESPVFVETVRAAIARLSGRDLSALLNCAPLWPENDEAARVAKITPATRAA